MADSAYEISSLRARRDETQGMYLLEADIGGVFVPFSAIKIGHVDELLQRDQERQAQERREQDERDREQERLERERQSQPQESSGQSQ